MPAPATRFFLGLRMIVVPIPASHQLARLPQVLDLESRVRDECVHALIDLWSWTAEHGSGPHSTATIERVLRWRGDNGAFVRALVETGWVDDSGGGYVVVPTWQEALGYVDPAPVDETAKDRARRLGRERVRRHRELKNKQVEDRYIGNDSVTAMKRSVTVGNGNETLGNGFGNASVTVGNAETDPSRARSLSLSSYSEKYSEEEPEAEGEQNTEVVVAAGASTVMAVRSAPEGHGFSASGEAGGQTSLFAPVAVSPSARPAAIGQERPAIASGSTIGVEVRSVPVPASDRASEGNSGGRGKRGRGGKKAAVDPQTVEGPIRQVWTAYAEVVGGRVVLSRERAELIADRLADGWTADDLVEAVRGYGKSAWHFGANDRGARFTSIELWLRDSAHVEQGLGHHKEAAKPTVAPKAVDPIKNPPRGGFEEKFAKYFEEKQRKEAEMAAGEQ